LRILPSTGADTAELAERLVNRVTPGLRGLGIRDPRIAVELCLAIERPASGKLQLVVADPRPHAMA
jgi:hypothetical protein